MRFHAVNEATPLKHVSEVCVGKGPGEWVEPVWSSARVRCRRSACRGRHPKWPRTPGSFAGLGTRRVARKSDDARCVRRHTQAAVGEPGSLARREGLEPCSPALTTAKKATGHFETARRGCSSKPSGAAATDRQPADHAMDTPDALRLSRLDRLINQLGEHQLSIRQQVRAQPWSGPQTSAGAACAACLPRC